MGSTRARRLKRTAPLVARLRALNITSVKDGHELTPGTAEHDRHLEILARHLSEADVTAMEAHHSRSDEELS